MSASETAPLRWVEAQGPSAVEYSTAESDATRRDDAHGGDSKWQEAFRSCGYQDQRTNGESRRARRSVHADDPAAPVIIRQFINDSFAGGPQQRRCRTEQEPQWEPGVYIWKKTQRDQRARSQQGCVLHGARGAGTQDQPRHQRCKQHTGTGLRDDTEADDSLADTLRVEHQ